MPALAKFGLNGPSNCSGILFERPGDQAHLRSSRPKKSWICQVTYYHTSKSGSKKWPESSGINWPICSGFGGRFESDSLAVLINIMQAQASGCPVIAFHAGGAIETVIENVTGIFFQNQTIADLIAALDRFEKIKFDAQNIRQAAMRFGESVFQNKMRDFIHSVM